MKDRSNPLNIEPDNQTESTNGKVKTEPDSLSLVQSEGSESNRNFQAD